VRSDEEKLLHSELGTQGGAVTTPCPSEATFPLKHFLTT
jgi:hypothetical protein